MYSQASVCERQANQLRLDANTSLHPAITGSYYGQEAHLDIKARGAMKHLAALMQRDDAVALQSCSAARGDQLMATTRCSRRFLAG